MNDQDKSDVYALFAPSVFAQEDAAKAQRVVALWQRPAVPEGLVPEMVGLPDKAWTELKLTGKAPPRFRIGKREFVRVADLVVWLERMAAEATREAA